MTRRFCNVIAARSVPARGYYSVVSREGLQNRLIEIYPLSYLRLSAGGTLRTTTRRLPGSMIHSNSSPTPTSMNAARAAGTVVRRLSDLEALLPTLVRNFGMPRPTVGCLLVGRFMC